MSRGAWGGALAGVAVAAINSTIREQSINYAVLLGSALFWGWIGHKVYCWFDRAR